MKQLFIATILNYNANLALTNEFWRELEKHYTHKKRHYHTLAHIENMLHWAAKYQTQVADWDTFILAIYYHDAVYNVLKSDNEEQSALLAEKRLLQLHFPAEKVAYCKALILATKQHAESEDWTTNLLIDIDLSVLGADWDVYSEYAQQVRREYSIYPDLLYNPGRRKVLEKFLERDFIYKTVDFRKNLEGRARENLKKEIITLNA